MTVLRPPVSTPLDDFLAEAGSSTDAGERLVRIGLIGSLTGVLIAFGLLVFLASVHRGPSREVRVLLRGAGLAGALALVGAVIEIAGIASVADESWSDALTSSNGSAAMMRLLAGLLIVLGLMENTMPIVGTNSDLLVEVMDGPSAGDDRAVADTVRWLPSSASAFGLAGALIGVFSFAFDGHTVSKGPRAVHAVVNIVHVGAGGAWFGGVVGLAAVAMLRARTGSATGPLVVRFSSIATVALIAVTVAGVLMSLMIIDDVGDLTGTQWGRLLLIKTFAVGVTVAIGAYNHFVVVPALERQPDPATVARRARTTVTLEAIVLLCVVIVTVFLKRASIN